MHNNLTNILLVIILIVQLLGFSLILNRSSDSGPALADAISEIERDVSQLKLKRLENKDADNVVVAGVSKREIAQLIEEALSNWSASGQYQADSQAAYQYAEQALTVEQEQARLESEQQANTVMDSAILSGRWTDHDTEALLPHLGNLSAEQREALIAKFMQAISQNELQLTAPPPPL